jgi:predicted amidohydrolase
MQVALVQSAPVLGQLDANVEHAGELVEEAAGRGADLVVLPELALSGYAVRRAGRDTSLRRDDPRLGQLASRAGDAALVVGFHERADDGRFHSSMAWLEHGALVALHRKLFLAGGRWDESRSFAPGAEVSAFDTGLGRVAMLACNDAWHPVAPWLAARGGAELLVVSAASADPLPGERLDIAATWDDLLRATARLLQVVVVFVNRSGEEAGLRYWGGSRVIDPWGSQLGRAGREEGLTVVEVDPGSVAAARAEYEIACDSAVALALASAAVRRTATSD